jgi:hypothetical protein
VQPSRQMLRGQLGKIVFKHTWLKCRKLPFARSPMTWRSSVCIDKPATILV